MRPLAVPKHNRNQDSLGTGEKCPIERFSAPGAQAPANASETSTRWLVVGRQVRLIEDFAVIGHASWRPMEARLGQLR